ncbi:MAG: gamma carbonic anhydrase family protein [Acidobacteria bacterium]|nr:gamma carbonic anhydrase family protein [Acidobacteriota bacterium]
MPILEYRGRLPVLGRRVFLAPTAYLSGDVEVGDDVSFWFHTVARGDVNFIRIGEGTNVQDGAVLHVSHETFPLVIGRRVVVGHGAVLHGCTIEDEALIGIGARILDGAVVEKGAQVGAGALVPPGKRVPAGTLVMGVPARPVRQLSEDEREAIRENARHYVELKDEYLEVLRGSEVKGDDEA